MKTFTWDRFYESFFDWSLSTQKQYSRGLINYGPADEVFEVLNEFAFYDKAFASRFAEKAIDGGVHFTPEQVLELTILIEQPTLSRMAETASPAFNKEELEEIYLLIDDDAFQRISKKEKIDIFADETEDMEEYEEPIEEEYFDIAPLPRKVGFFGNLLGAAGIAAALLGGGNSRKKKRHTGRCDGDCANCPPHYGYRYGRWYYGRGHIYGCVYGGNRGDGSLN